MAGLNPLVERRCEGCGKVGVRRERRCSACRRGEAPERPCVDCRRVGNWNGHRCNTCVRRGRCWVCRRPSGGGSRCAACIDAAVAISNVEKKRPPDGWPPGHLERLAERAALGLPLFE